MRKKWMALAVALCLLLSGCGGTTKGASSQEPASAPAEASEQMAISATELDATEAVEVSQTEEDQAAETANMSPEELGQWAWTQMETYGDNAYAIDYDMDISLTVDLDGETTSQKATGRVKEIDSETDGEITYSSMQTNGTVTESWTGGGYVYLSDSNGKYKAPITDEDEQTEVAGGDDLLELDAGSFSTLTAEKTDKGYTITFGDPSLDTWMAFSDMFTGVDDSVTCTAFGLNGTAEIDENGATRQIDMEISVQFDVLGMTLSETVVLSQTTNCYDDDVSIHVPETDAEFREVSDISLPTAFINGYNTLLSQYGVSYQSQLNINITDGSVADDYVETNAINYVYDEDNGLSMTWDTDQTLDGETVGQSTDTYANGAGVQVIDGEETSYTYDDASTMSDIQNNIAFYSGCFAYGSDYKLEQDGDYQKLTMTLDSEYVEMIAAAYLDGIGADFDMNEASEITSNGTISFWYDLNGMLVMQLYQSSSTMSFTGAELTVSITDNGAVMAVNDGVTVNAGA